MIKRIGRIFTVLCMILLLAPAAVLTIPKLMMIKPFEVLTGSMTPVFPVGSLVYVKEVSPSVVKAGDPITFHLDSATIITHRVIRIDAGAQKFYTKGDANNTPDGFSVPYSHLIGKVVFCVPYLGYYAEFSSTASGNILLATLFVCLMIVTFLPGALMGNTDKQTA